MTTAITFDRVSKRYGEVRAVEDVSFAIEPGEMFGLIGPDGAGKTTSIRMACGLLRADGGHISVLGRDPVMRLLVAAHVLLAAGLGEAVWLRWLDFGRVLLPLSLVGVLALASRARCEHASPEVAEDGDVAVRVPIASVGRP